MSSLVYVNLLEKNDPQETELVIRHFSFNEESLSKFSDALKANKFLTKLSFDDSVLNADAEAITDALKVNTSLTTLRIINNSIRDEGTKAIADALKFNTALTTLSLGNNKIGDHGVKAIAEALKDNKVLNRIYLHRNLIGKDGAKAIADALKFNTVLTTLHLNGNLIGDEGAKDIADALKFNTVLTTLQLNWNSIGDEGAKAIAAALKVNPVLTTLYLTSNSISDNGAKEILNALESQTVLTKLVLGENGIDSEIKKEIECLVDSNKLHLRKYQMEKEDKHVSNTCVVGFGTEFDKISGDMQEIKVALKLFKDSSTFLHELEKQNTIMEIPDAGSFIMRVRAKYTSSKDGLSAAYADKIELCKNVCWKEKHSKEKYKHLLVMDCLSSNDLSDILSHQNIAGKDILLVRSIAIDIAKCLQFLNEKCKVMHGDVKARNFVSRGEGLGYAAIDFDNAAIIGSEKAGQKQTSSGYLPPEQAVVEYHMREKEQSPTEVNASPQYDMWCFGALLYYLCTGYQLFDVNDHEEVNSTELLKIVYWNDDGFDKLLQRKMPDSNDWQFFKPLLKKLLKKDPEDRFKGWTEIIHKLEDNAGFYPNKLQQEIEALHTSMYQLQTEFQEVKLHFSKFPDLMIQLETVKCPYIFKILSKDDFEMFQKTCNENPTMCGRADNQVDEMNEIIDKAEKLWGSRKKETALKRWKNPLCTTEAVYLQLLCGMTLKPLVSYKVKNITYSKKMKMCAEIGEKLCAIGVIIAVLWNMAVPLASGLGCPAPGLPKDCIKKCQRFLKTMNDISPLKNLKEIEKSGFNQSQLQDFENFIEGLEKDGMMRQCLKEFDKKKLARKTWQDALKKHVIDCKEFQKQVTFISIDIKEKINR